MAQINKFLGLVIEMMPELPPKVVQDWIQHPRELKYALANALRKKPERLLVCYMFTRIDEEHPEYIIGTHAGVEFDTGGFSQWAGIKYSSHEEVPLSKVKELGFADFDEAVASVTSGESDYWFFGNKPERGRIRIMCPHPGCRQIAKVSGNSRGKTVRCPACGTHIKVPKNAPSC